MVRLAVFSCGLALLTACAARETTSKSPSSESAFHSEEERADACRRLRDHIVVLYADASADEDGVSMSPEARAKLRSDWAAFLQARGTFDRFAASCTAGLTPRKYRCGMASTTTYDLLSCMKLSANERAASGRND